MHCLQAYGGIQTYRGVWIYGGIWTWGCTVTWGHMDIMRFIDIWGAYGCTHLPTTPEGICKKFSFPLIMNHVHHLSTETEGKNYINA